MRQNQSVAAAEDQPRDVEVRRSRWAASNVVSATSAFAQAGVAPQWLSRLSVQMGRLLNLPENWNSYGSQRINPSIANAALTLLGELSSRNTPAPSLIPTNDGKVQIEWHVQGIDLEITILSQVGVSYCLDDHRGDLIPVEDKQLNYDLSDLQSAIMRLTARAMAPAA